VDAEKRGNGVNEELMREKLDCLWRIPMIAMQFKFKEKKAVVCYHKMSNKAK